MTSTRLVMALAVEEELSDVLPSGTVRIAVLYALNIVSRTVASDAALNGCQGCSLPRTEVPMVEELVDEIATPHSTVEVALASA
jgi:hypothetical protein